MRPKLPLAKLGARMRELVDRRLPPGDPARPKVLGLIDRAERIFDGLEATGQVIDKVARAELAIVEALKPIVADLGELVKLELEDARRRLGRTVTRAPAEPAEHAPALPTKVIDVE